MMPPCSLDNKSSRLQRSHFPPHTRSTDPRLEAWRCSWWRQEQRSARGIRTGWRRRSVLRSRPALITRPDEVMEQGCCLLHCKGPVMASSRSQSGRHVRSWRKLTCCRKTANSRLPIRPRWCGRFALDTEGSSDERPCLHCLIGDTIEDFYAEYGTLSGETEAIDVEEIISALGKVSGEEEREEWTKGQCSYPPCVQTWP